MKHTPQRRTTFAITAVFLASLWPSSALANKPLFESDEPVKAVLKAPLNTVYKERKKDVRLYQEGTFSYHDAQGIKQLGVKIKTRGNFRRLNCSLPPLRLNFVKKANDGTLFERQNKLKLVAPCKSGERYQELIGLEYLVYQMWQRISDYHFKTRWLDLSYIDSDGKRKPWQAGAFVIEDIDDVAKRMARKRLKQERVARQQMHREATALVEVFQLLIGNNDYSTLVAAPGDACCHNVRLLVEKGKTSDAIPVPYDFDVSGFVDAPYATPPDQYPIRSVTQRYFTGWCKEPRHFQSAVAQITGKKSELYALVENAEYISAKSRTKALDFLADFFAIVSDPKRLDKELLGRCRGELIPG